MVSVKQQHIIQLFNSPAEVSVEVQKGLNARQRPLVSVVGKRLKTKGY